ncbi:MAG: hypothetical protein ACE15C_20655 [Phycisphaerae bacterium]
MKTKAARAFPPAEGWVMEDAKMIGDQIWVQWRREKRVGRGYDYTSRRFDPSRGAYEAGAPDLDGQRWVTHAVPGSAEGKRSVFVNTDDKNIILAYPVMRKIAGEGRDQAVPAGNFWWVGVRKTKETTTRPSVVEGADLYDPEAKRICTVGRDEIENLTGRNPHRGGRRQIRFAGLSDDKKVLALASGSQGVYDFGVFATDTGKYLWGGTTWGALTGNPLISRDGIWVLEQILKKQPDGTTSTGEEMALGLVRYAPDPNEDATKAKREVAMELPIAKGWPFPRTGDEYNPSPDGSHFVMTLNGSPSRLLFIPIKKGLTTKDVNVVDLVEVNHAASGRAARTPTPTSTSAKSVGRATWPDRALRAEQWR